MPPVAVNAFLFCDSVSRDNRQKTIIVGVFDTIFAKKFPAMHGSMAAYFRLRIPEPHQGRRLQIRMTPPSGLAQPSPEIPIAIGPGGIAEGTVNFQGFPMPLPGDYEIALLIDGEEVARYTIHAEQLRGDDDAVH